jgi:hypothetical protein
MKNKVFAVLFAMVALLMVSGPMFAHHSTAVYDRARYLSLKATVTKYEFINPHILIHFDVKDANGNVEHWTAQCGHVYRAGPKGAWDKTTFKPGEEITISGNPYKDGRSIMRALKIVRANGQDVPVEPLPGDNPGRDNYDR